MDITVHAAFHYLQCPLKYKYHYLQGWRKRTIRRLWFSGGCLKAPWKPISGGDSVQFFTERWAESRTCHSRYTNATAGKDARAGAGATGTVPAGTRVLIEDGERDFQIKFRRPLPLTRNISLLCGRGGVRDGRWCLIEWKTTASVPGESGRILELDPQLVCYSWAAQCQQVSLVNFVRKKQPEIQYLRARIRKRQWKALSRPCCW